MVEPLEASLERERELLGAALIDGHKQAEILAAHGREDDFISSLHRSVFLAIQRVVERGEVPLGYRSVVIEMLASKLFESPDNAHSYVSALGWGVVLSRPMIKRIEGARQAANRRREALHAEVSL